MPTRDAFGLQFLREDSGTPGTYVKTALEVIGGGFPNATRDAIDKTHFESPGGWKEFFGASLKDGGEVTVMVQYYDLDDLDEFYDDFIATDAINYQWRDGDAGATFNFAGVITSIDPGEPKIDGRFEGEMTIKVSGPPAWAGS